MVSSYSIDEPYLPESKIQDATRVKDEESTIQKFKDEITDLNNKVNGPAAHDKFSKIVKPYKLVQLRGFSEGLQTTTQASSSLQYP